MFSEYMYIVHVIIAHGRPPYSFSASINLQNRPNAHLFIPIMLIKKSANKLATLLYKSVNMFNNAQSSNSII